MATMYSQPAAANYYTTPHGHHAAPRSVRICNSCNRQEAPQIKFRTCGGCMTTQYCSAECQKAHWPSHKQICQHTAATVKQHSTGSSQADENLVKHLHKFTTTHEKLLGWAGFQALQLKRMPANIRSHALLVELNPTNHADAHRRFAVRSASLVPRTYVTDRDPLVAAEIRGRDEHSRKSGGIGTIVVLIQCNGISQVMPVEVDHPSKITWDTREDWDAVLRHFVDSGRTDFKPISTTSRGTYYG